MKPSWCRRSPHDHAIVTGVVAVRRTPTPRDDAQDNAESDEPDDESFYAIMGREWDRETEELLNLVADKALSGDDAVALAQDALFEITDEDGLTDSTRTKLANLP